MALKVTITELQKNIAENANTAVTVTAIHQDLLQKLRSQLVTLRNSEALLKAMKDNHAREIVTIREKIDAVVESEWLKTDDHDETIFLLCCTMKELESQHRITYGAWKKSNEKEQQLAGELIVRAQALLAHAKEAVNLEGTVRKAVKSDLEKKHQEHVASGLLEDGILVWASRTNQFAIMMTQCMMHVHDHQITIMPTKLSFDPQFFHSFQEKYRMDYVSTDFGKPEVTISLHDVDELRFVKRRAVVPGTSDEHSPHYEPCKYHQCVYIHTRFGAEYYVTDRKNESRGKTWGSIQRTPDGSPSLLCDKLLEIWQRVKNNLPS